MSIAKKNALALDLPVKLLNMEANKHQHASGADFVGNHRTCPKASQLKQSKMIESPHGPCQNQRQWVYQGT